MNENKFKPLKRGIDVDFPQRRFGFIAIEKDFIKADQLYEALIRQRAQETGRAEGRLLGMILKDMGYLSVSQIDECLKILEDEAVPREKTPGLPKPKRAARSTKKTGEKPQTVTKHNRDPGCSPIADFSAKSFTMRHGTD
jgi:hypothetical protein